MASAPTVVMTATATTHVAVPMSMAAKNKDNLIIGSPTSTVVAPGISKADGRRCRQCSGGDADQQHALYFINFPSIWQSRSECPLSLRAVSGQEHAGEPSLPGFLESCAGRRAVQNQTFANA